MGVNCMRLTRWIALTPALLVTLPSLASAQTVAEVQVAPAAITLRVHTTQRLVAVAYDAAGNVITTVHYKWTSNNLNVAKVDSTGAVSAVGDGSAVIRAEAIGSGPPPRHGVAVITVRGRAP